MVSGGVITGTIGDLVSDVATFDFHVTSECSQECPYCWGPQDIAEVDTETALAIVTKIAGTGARRTVFTGGDPLKRADIGELIHHAKSLGLEVAVADAGEATDPIPAGRCRRRGEVARTGRSQGG